MQLAPQPYVYISVYVYVYIFILCFSINIHLHVNTDIDIGIHSLCIEGSCRRRAGRAAQLDGRHVGEFARGRGGGGGAARQGEGVVGVGGERQEGHGGRRATDRADGPGPLPARKMRVLKPVLL